MKKRKGLGGSPSSPRFVLEDGQQIEVAALEDIPGKPRRRGRPPLNRPKLVEVTLQMRHSINGRFFGPGPVRVTENDAQHFLNTEHVAAEKELSLVQERAFLIGMQNGVPVKREVPAQRFDSLLMREELPVGTMPHERR